MAGAKIRRPLFFVGLGSNLGDRGALLCSALSAVATLGTIRAFSHVFETTPMGPSTFDFLNAALTLESELSPDALLRELQRIEHENGRVRAQRWDARTLDLDLLLAGDLRIDSADLTVPHPRLHERAFVLAPLVCIAKSVIIPKLGLSVSSAWQAISHGGVRLYVGTDVPVPLQSDLAALQAR